MDYRFKIEVRLFCAQSLSHVQLFTTAWTVEISLLYPLGFSRQEYLEKAMAPYSNTLAWKIPWTEKPGRLQSMRSLRVRHD